MIQTFIVGTAGSAASLAKRASSRAGVSFSPPIVRLIAASCGVSFGGGPSAKEPDVVPVSLAVLAERGADDVVREHPCDVLSGRLGLHRVEGRAEGALLLAREGDEFDRGVELVRGHHASHLEHRTDAGAVVARSGRVAREVEHVGATGVSKTHWVAAPILRFGSVWEDSVCRVPKPTSVWIELWMLSALIALTISRVSLGTEPCSSPLAGPVAKAIAASAARTPAVTTANAAYCSLRTVFLLTERTGHRYPPLGVLSDLDSFPWPFARVAEPRIAMGRAAATPAARRCQGARPFAKCARWSPCSSATSRGRRRSANGSIPRACAASWPATSRPRRRSSSATAAPSRSSSATRSWPSSASRRCTRTTRCARCGRRTSCGPRWPAGRRSLSRRTALASSYAWASTPARS